METAITTSTKIAPIKRNINLVPLSREHHTGLLFGWKIKQGISKNVPMQTLVSYVRFFWENHLRQHIASEELLLNSLLQLHDPMRMTIEEDHRLIEEKIKYLLSGNPATENKLLTLVNLLNTHIRFEEREFFLYLEQTLTPGQLAAIGESLHPLKPEKEEEFKPAFWLRDYSGQAA